MDIDDIRGGGGMGSWCLMKAQEAFYYRNSLTDKQLQKSSNDGYVLVEERVFARITTLAHVDIMVYLVLSLMHVMGVIMVKMILFKQRTQWISVI